LTAVAAGVLVFRWDATGTALSIIGVLEFDISVGLRILLTILLAGVVDTFTRLLKWEFIYLAIAGAVAGIVCQWGFRQRSE